MADLINVGAAANDGTGDTLREAFTKLNTAYADSPKVSKSTGTIDVKPDNSGGFPTAILSTFTGSATTNLTDGNEHAVQFQLESGGDWTAATDSRMWYLHVAELGNIDGASGVITVDMMKQWISNGNIITMKYDATPKRFHVTKVEGHHVLPASVPQVPTADGTYNLEVTSGQITWSTVAAPPPPPPLPDLNRPTVVSPYSATPTKAQLITAIKLLPDFIDEASFWQGSYDFYVRDDPQTKMILIKYRGIATNVDETTAGNFFFEKLTKAS